MTFGGTSGSREVLFGLRPIGPASEATLHRRPWNGRDPSVPCVPLVPSVRSPRVLFALEPRLTLNS